MWDCAEVPGDRINASWTIPFLSPYCFAHRAILWLCGSVLKLVFESADRGWGSLCLLSIHSLACECGAPVTPKWPPFRFHCPLFGRVIHPGIHAAVSPRRYPVPIPSLLLPEPRRQELLLKTLPALQSPQEACRSLGTSSAPGPPLL